MYTIFSPLIAFWAPGTCTWHLTCCTWIEENINKMCFEAVNESGMNTFLAAVNSTADGWENFFSPGPDPCPPSSIIKYQFNTKLPRGDMSLKCKSDDWWWGAFQWPPSWHVTLIKHTLSSLVTNWGFLPRLQSSSASGVFGTNVFPVPVWCEYKLFVSSLTNCPCPRLFCLKRCQRIFVTVFRDAP